MKVWSLREILCKKWKVAWNNFEFSDVIKSLFIYGRFLFQISRRPHSKIYRNIKFFNPFHSFFNHHYFSSLMWKKFQNFWIFARKNVAMTKIVSSKAIGRWVITQLTFSKPSPLSSSTSSTTANRRPHTQNLRGWCVGLYRLRPLFGRRDFQKVSLFLTLDFLVNIQNGCWIIWKDFWIFVLMTHCVVIFAVA